MTVFGAVGMQRPEDVPIPSSSLMHEFMCLDLQFAMYSIYLPYHAQSLQWLTHR